jgi:hypothetical protein
MGWKLAPDLERRVLELAAQAATEPHRLGVAPVSEKAFQAAVMMLAKREGWRAYHTHDSRKSAAGFPDTVAVHPVRGLWFGELKVEPNKPTAEQMNWIEVLQSVTRPPVVGVYYPRDWAEIERILKGGGL